jgi:hypothetical protein
MFKLLAFLLTWQIIGTCAFAFALSSSSLSLQLPQADSSKTVDRINYVFLPEISDFKELPVKGIIEKNTTTHSDYLIEMFIDQKQICKDTLYSSAISNGIFQHDLLLPKEKGIKINQYNSVELHLSSVKKTNDSIITFYTVKQQVYFIKEEAKREVLIEHFTNTSCGTCGYMNPFLFELINQDTNRSRVAHIVYHTSWPGYDPMYDFNESNGQGDARVDNYGVGAIPIVHLGGNFFEGYPKDVSQKMINVESAEPALFDMKLKRKEMQDSIKFNLNLISLADFTTLVPNDLHAWVVLTEDLAYEEPPGANQEKFFPNAMRYMVSGEEGVSIGRPEYGDTVKLQFAQYIDDQIKRDSLNLVVFVQDTADNDIFMAETKNYVSEPEVKITLENQQEQVSLNSDISISFNQPVSNWPEELAVSFNLTKGTLDGQTVPFTLEVNDDTSEVILKPDTLYPSMTYFFWLTQTLVNPEGDYFNSDTVQFQTITPGVPELTFYPPDESSSVPVDTSFYLSFSQDVRYTDNTPIENPGRLIDFRENSSNGFWVDHSVTWEIPWRKIRIDPLDSLNFDQKYYLSMTDTLENEYDVSLLPDSVYFITQSNPETTLRQLYSQKLQVFPNPARTYITIEAPDKLVNEILTIEVIDLTGRIRKIIHVEDKDTPWILGVANFNPGLYLLKFKTESAEVFTKKIEVSGLY